MTVEIDRAERSRIDVPVLIVGAGPTGLVLALWLTRLGVAMRINAVSNARRHDRRGS